MSSFGLEDADVAHLLRQHSLRVGFFTGAPCGSSRVAVMFFVHFWIKLKMHIRLRNGGEICVESRIVRRLIT